MRTIIQHIGPLYGEANQGTVFGQPNGSIAVGQGYSPGPSPTPTPEIEQIWTISYQTVTTYVTSTMQQQKQATYLRGVKNGLLNVMATGNYQNGWTQSLCKVSLDETISATDNVMTVQIADSEDFSNILITGSATSGTYTTVPNVTTPISIVAGTKYYLRLRLFDSAGNDLYKISNTLVLTGASS